jgi:aarF domain-containing kinase
LAAGAPCHSFSHTAHIIEKELGLPVDEVFSEFDRTPVASGSVAQVYKAVYNGQPVAVKVRHPGVEEQIRDDFVVLGGLASFLGSFESLQWMNLESSLSQFSHTMADQVMLDAEARHLTRFIHLFWGRSGVSFPVPCYPLVTPAVLVESFEFASSVTDSINADLTTHVRKYVVRQVRSICSLIE